MNKPARKRKSMALRRALMELASMMNGDLECSDSDRCPRWKGQRRLSIIRAIEWIEKEARTP